MLLRIFASMFIRNIDLYFLILQCSYLHADLIKRVWKCFLFIYFLKEFEKNWYKLFKCLIEFFSEDIQFWAFLCSEVLITHSISISSFINFRFNESVQIFYFFMIQTWQAAYFQACTHFFQVFQFVRRITCNIARALNIDGFKSYSGCQSYVKGYNRTQNKSRP